MADDIVDLPFRAEYAKSGRAACKMCKEKIDKGELRLAVMVQSPMFDGKVPHWYHPKCFFVRNRPKAVGDISHYDSLRWEDQEDIRKMLENCLKGGTPAAVKSGKKAAKGSKNGEASGGLSAHGTIMKDFRLELAKSGASKCGVCEEKIKKGEVRAGKKEFDSQRAKMYGPYDRWHHIPCFAEKREELGYYDAGDAMAGFMLLGPEDKELIKSKLKPMKRKIEATTKGGDEPDAKKVKVEDDSKERDAIKKQMKKIFYYRDLLERNLKKNELQDLLEANSQEVPTGVEPMLDRLSDIMTFGALEPCQECKGGQLVFRSGVGYQCTGDMSEWTKCQYKTVLPKRKAFKVPGAFKETYNFLNIYNCKIGARIIPNNPSTVKAAQANQTNGTSSSKVNFPLKGATFVLDDSIKGDKREKMKEKIKAFGGVLDKRVSSRETVAVIAMKDAMEKAPSKYIEAAEKKKIQVVSPDVLTNVGVEGLLSNVKSHTISSWGSDPKDRIKGKEEEKHSSGKKSGSMFMSKEMPKSVKMKLKGGGFVDPESGLEEKAHVLKVKDALYSVVLGSVSIQEDKNSFYKLQVLEHDKKPKWWLFRSWGRIGTTIGNTKLEDFAERLDALRQFESLYEEKTGNRWKNRDKFQKVPKKMYPLEMDYGQDAENIKKLDLTKSKSKLDKKVQELITTIFDIESMKKAMIEFEIDMTKMPMGKISKKQIEKAYGILTEVQNMIKNGDGTDSKFLDASNRFFTLIPHDFGLKTPPILNEPDYIKSKIEMLDSLLEIEVAYKLLKDGADDKEKDPIDVHYENLKTELNVLDKETDEFKTIEKYVKNTHAETHNLYTLEIQDVFKVHRKGESKRFKPFKQLPNRKLLWHGSRTTNYAGILSQGLRIAPPEAPVTGYMFGKGVYFADMVSKSANYCNTTRSNNTGLLLLCDVALGEMYERTAADYIEKLPKGKHSCKGVGKTTPDPSETTEIDGAQVPYGKGVKQSDVPKTDLLYNEYIVYDVGQVNCKYLLKLKFNYKF